MSPRRVYESVPAFYNERDARAVVADVKRYFDVEPIVQLRGFVWVLSLPDSLVGDDRVLVETFIVAWGAGNQHGHEQVLVGTV